MKTTSKWTMGQMGLGLALAGAALSTGCATPALWRTTAAHRCEPSDLVDVRTWTNAAQPDLVIIYREQHFAKAKSEIRTRAYLLLATQTNLVASRLPAFVPMKVATNLVKGPIFLSPETPANDAPRSPRYVTLGRDDRQFTVHAAGAEECAYALPSYVEKTKTWTRVLLAPAAVAADAAITGAVLFALGASGAAY